MVRAEKGQAGIRRSLRDLRSVLEPAFGPDTAADGYGTKAPSAGQCAVAAVVIHQVFGGELRSAKVNGKSHWFNRIPMGAKQLDVDITGDQFGLPPLQVAPVDGLYDGTRSRPFSDLDALTLCRARVLAQRANLEDVVRTLDLTIQALVEGGSR